MPSKVVAVSPFTIQFKRSKFGAPSPTTKPLIFLIHQNFDNDSSIPPGSWKSRKIQRNTTNATLWPICYTTFSPLKLDSWLASTIKTTRKATLRFCCSFLTGTNNLFCACDYSSFQGTKSLFSFVERKIGENQRKFSTKFRLDQFNQFELNSIQSNPIQSNSIKQDAGSIA